MSDVQLNQDFWKLLPHAQALPLKFFKNNVNFLASFAARFVQNGVMNSFLVSNNKNENKPPKLV